MLVFCHLVATKELENGFPGIFLERLGDGGDLPLCLIRALPVASGNNHQVLSLLWEMFYHTNVAPAIILSLANLLHTISGLSE